MRGSHVKIITSCVAAAIALLGVGSACAAEADKATVSWVFNDSVAPPDQTAYETAIKNFNKCLGQHGFKFSWTAWTHETGDTYRYSYVAGPYTWADVDTMHASGKACQDAWRSEGNAHLKSETSAFLVAMPELSRMPKDKNAKPALINVTYFTLNNGLEADAAFTDGVKKITAAAEKSKWSLEYTTYKVRGADKDAPDYILVSPYKSFADYGAGPNPAVWKMLESADGKQEADAVHKAINDAIKDASSHVDSYSEELTYNTPKK
jgi:hypothetical protein